MCISYRQCKVTISCVYIDIPTKAKSCFVWLVITGKAHLNPMNEFVAVPGVEVIT